MNNFTKYVIKNFQQIICILLISIFFAFLIFPIIIQLDIIKNFPINPSMDLLIAITALILFLLILTTGRLKKLLYRCKNTYNLEDPPSLYPLNIFLFILISILIIIRFQNEYISVLNISLKFIVFLSFNSAFRIMILLQFKLIFSTTVAGCFFSCQDTFDQGFRTSDSGVNCNCIEFAVYHTGAAFHAFVFIGNKNLIFLKIKDFVRADFHTHFTRFTFFRKML